MASKNRPGGMDSTTLNQVLPTQKTPMPKSSMGIVASVAAGKVDDGKAITTGLPSGDK